MNISRCLMPFFAAAILASAQPNNPDAALGAARHLEEAEGNFPAAIQAYKKVLAQHGKNRPVAAKALIRMAECYQKMGDAEARKIYEQVVREYGDQKDEAAEARAHLAGAAGPRRLTDTLISRNARARNEMTVTPDGRYLVSFDYENTGEIVLRDYLTGIDRPITSYKQPKMAGKVSFKESSDNAAISRDGKQLAYQWNTAAGSELRVLTIGDPNSRRLFFDPDVIWIEPHDWSPDGRLVSLEIDRKDKTIDIGVISVADGKIRVLKSLGENATGSILFSPDGKYLAYDMHAPRSTAKWGDIVLLPVEGGRETAVELNRGENILMGWAQDGRILFASDRSGSIDLYGIPVRDGKAQGPAENLQVGIGTGGWLERLGMSRAGTLFYARATGGQHATVQIARFDERNGKIVSPGKDVSNDYLESNSSPKWSADGKFIAYRSDRGRPGATSTVIVIRSVENGQIERQVLPKMSMWNFLSSWAPDGHAFVIRGTDLQGRWGAFEVNAQTGDVAPLHLDEPGESHGQPGPAFAPTGKSYYFLRGVGTNEVTLLQHDIAAGTDRELLRRPFLGGINVSPDGKYIASPSVDAPTNSRGILLVPTGGGESRMVIQAPSGVSPAELAGFSRGAGRPMTGNTLLGVRWASDSRSFLIGKNIANPPARETWRVPIDGSAPSQVDFSAGVPSPDGQNVAIEVTESSPRVIEIRSLENLLPGSGVKH